MALNGTNEKIGVLYATYIGEYLAFQKAEQSTIQRQISMNTC